MHARWLCALVVCVVLTGRAQAELKSAKQLFGFGGSRAPRKEPDAEVLPQDIPRQGGSSGRRGRRYPSFRGRRHPAGGGGRRGHSFVFGGEGVPGGRMHPFMFGGGQPRVGHTPFVLAGGGRTGRYPFVFRPGGSGDAGPVVVTVGGGRGGYHHRLPLHPGRDVGGGFPVIVAGGGRRGRFPFVAGGGPRPGGARPPRRRGRRRDRRSRRDGRDGHDGRRRPGDETAARPPPPAGAEVPARRSSRDEDDKSSRDRRRPQSEDRDRGSNTHHGSGACHDWRGGRRSRGMWPRRPRRDRRGPDDRRRRGFPGFGFGGFPWLRRRRFPRGFASGNPPERGPPRRPQGRRDRRRPRGRRGRRRPSFFDSFFPGRSAALSTRGFGIFSPEGNSNFGSGEQKRQNVCSETRRYWRPTEDGDRDDNTSPPRRRCTSTQGFRLCVSRRIVDGRVKVTERLERCCSGTMPSYDGCKKVHSEKAALQLQRLRSARFLDLLEMAGLGDALDDRNTIFVPSDSAVEAFLNRTKLKPKSKEMKTILQGHIVKDSLPLAVLVLWTPVESGSGPLWLSVGSRGPQVNCVPLSSRDRHTRSGGVIHTVENIIRATNSTLMQAIGADKTLSTFAKLLKDTDLDEDIKKHMGFTIFAPNNEAFKNVKLPKRNREKRAILRGHMIGGLQCWAGLPGVAVAADGHVVSLYPRAGHRVTLTPQWQPAGVHTLRLLRKDVVTRTGLLQVIDQVILPASVRSTLQTLLQLNSTRLLAELVAKAGLTKELNSENVTILVPPPDLLRNASMKVKDPAELKRLLGLHVLRRSVRSLRLDGGAVAVPTVAGGGLLVSGWHRRLLVQCVPVSDWLDVGKRRVSVLGLDRLVAPAAGDLTNVVGADPELSNFARLLKSSGMAETFKTGTYTLLAAVNTGLKNFKSINTKRKARRFIRRHTIEGAVCCGGFSWHGSQYQLVGGGAVLATALEGGGAAFRSVGDFSSPAVRSLACDVMASNGLVHKVVHPLSGPDANVDPHSVGFGFPYYQPFQFY